MGSPIPGTGTAIDLGNKTSGTYTIVGTSSTGGCVGNMLNSITVNSGAKPTAYTVTGGGNYCSGPGIAIGLSNSQTGVNYTLMLNGVTNAGFCYRNNRQQYNIWKPNCQWCIQRNRNECEYRLYEYHVKLGFHRGRLGTYSIYCGRRRQLLQQCLRC